MLKNSLLRYFIWCYSFFYCFCSFQVIYSLNNSQLLVRVCVSILSLPTDRYKTKHIPIMTRSIMKWTTSHLSSQRARFHHIHIFFLEVLFGLQKSKGTLDYVYQSHTGSLRTTWLNLTPFVPLLSYQIWSLGHIMKISSSRMGIYIKEEHLLADVSVMRSSELWRHSTHISLFKKSVFTTCSLSFPYIILLNVRALTPCILTPSDFFMGHNIQENHKPTVTPPSTVISAAENHSLPPFNS